MFEFLALITKNHYWKVHSLLIKFILKLYGIDVGKNFYCEGMIKFRVRGKYSNIKIGDNVKLYGIIYLMNRDNAYFEIGDDVIIETGFTCAIARETRLIIGKGTYIASDVNINGGKDITIGEYCNFAKNISVNASDHSINRDMMISKQGYINEEVYIGNDVWLGTNVLVTKGVRIEDGAVIGANAVVTKSLEAYSINVGIPAKKIKERV